MSQAKKTLLDTLTLLFPEKSREVLFSHVLCGDVFVDGECRKDPKEKILDRVEIVISPKRFVSRGGWKLDAALEEWQWAIADKVWLDAGASTGGFTDALLQRGARLVYAVDVGFNQLDWRLRQDDRVVSMEQTNIMSVESLPEPPCAAVADLSFRSLRGAARKILDLTDENRMIALVKPQFEWLNPPPNFEGIVQDDQAEVILQDLFHDLNSEGVTCKRLSKSAVRGRKGNQEFLAWLEG